MNSFNPRSSARHAGPHPRRIWLTIDVFFDLICPWCWIGTRHLASALNSLATLRPDVKAKVQWRSYPLLPETPAEGLPYQAFYLSRLSSPTAVAMRREQVQRAGLAAGIDFDFARISVLPNTRAAHGLINALCKHGAGGQPAPLIDRLFSAYFLEGEDIGNEAVLQRLASDSEAQHNAPANGFVDVQKPPPLSAEVRAVPYFVFNSAMAVSGAHPPGALLDAMLQSIPLPA
ncbi:DsbA family oxidoreductase [Ralstonia sp. UBA689]|uniref:DsbA family oxidoreductase n=1 Tax=Ralstonia sp. UBA689 TaxID=1947373 RepID=UPI0025D08215|nr:DsbA family oxidoreductase [Ralstonia sp. UBA689]